MAVDLELQIGMGFHQCGDLPEGAGGFGLDGGLVYIEQDAAGDELSIRDDLLIFIVATFGDPEIFNENAILAVAADGQVSRSAGNRIGSSKTILIDIDLSKRLVHIDGDVMPDAGNSQGSFHRSRHLVRRLASP